MIDDYQAGACNIGPAEITARRRFGHVSAAVTVLAFALLFVTGVPATWRLALFLPAAGAAAGYLQAALHFCADYGWRGVFNFGDEIRSTTSVATAAARAADRRKALLIVGGSAAIGALVALVAVLA